MLQPINTTTYDFPTLCKLGYGYADKTTAIHFFDFGFDPAKHPLVDAKAEALHV